MVKDFKDTDEAHAEKEANQTSRICNEWNGRDGLVILDAEKQFNKLIY